MEPTIRDYPCGTCGDKAVYEIESKPGRFAFRCQRDAQGFPVIRQAPERPTIDLRLARLFRATL